MKRSLLFLILKLFILVMLFFCGYLLLHPFQIVSQGYASTNQVDGNLEQSTTTYVYKLKRLTSLPVSSLNVELTGYSGIRIEKINFDENFIKCNATKLTDEIVPPKIVILHYKILGLKLKQTIFILS